MRSKNWLSIAVVVVFFTSCGDSSTKKDTVVTDNISTLDNKLPETNAMVIGNIVIPEPVKSSFAEKYPTANRVSWSRYEPVNTFDWDWAGWRVMDSSDYMVRYSVDGNDYLTWYDNENNWIGTVNTYTDYAGLPSAVSSSIQSNFPGYSIVSVDKENDKNRTAYELELTKGEDKMKALIAEDGTVMKKKGIVAGEKIKEKNL